MNFGIDIPFNLVGGLNSSTHRTHAWNAFSTARYCNYTAKCKLRHNCCILKNAPFTPVQHLSLQFERKSTLQFTCIFFRHFSLGGNINLFANKKLWVTTFLPRILHNFQACLMPLLWRLDFALIWLTFRSRDFDRDQAKNTKIRKQY